MFDFLKNKIINGIYIVRVVEDSDYFDLSDTLILELEDGALIQVLIEDGFKKTSLITDISKVKVWGDYDPIELKLLPLDVTFNFPFHVVNIVTYCAIDTLIKGCWESVNDERGSNYILGALFEGNTDAFFIRVAYEDIIVESEVKSIQFFKECNLEFEKC